MTRELLLSVVVLTLATACGPADAPGAPDAVNTASSAAGSAGPSPAASPSGITSHEAGRIAPLAPPSLTAVADAGRVRLEWPATGEDLAYYQCLRRPAEAGVWQSVGRAPAAQHTYVDPEPGDGLYIYGVQAVAVSGLASPITESQVVRIR
ncbi:hypothetical protein [Dactylosporangium sp. NPDC049140]|uniref:hypothetical protein n=1 Tax=Dactylosporangium sp. NPDC049140 TaxID=3155647 RepID=UPI0033FB29D5